MFMFIKESIASALYNVWGAKTRSVLTMLGIIIGITAVIMITAIGNGVQQQITDNFASWGLDVVSLRMKSDPDATSFDRLIMDDLNIIKSNPDVVEAAPLVTYWTFNNAVQLKNANKTRGVSFYGTSEAYDEVMTVDMLDGRFIAAQDIENQNNVIIIDDYFAQQVFGRSDVIGESMSVQLWMGPEIFTIVGVYKSTDNPAMVEQYNWHATVYTPYTTLMTTGGWGDFVDSFEIKVRDPEKIEEISENIIRFVERKHENEGRNMYETFNISGYLEQMQMVYTIFTLFLSFVAAISLFVGGIGVMNIMLVSVTERTREIGIRKSIGATNGNIQIQFLLESIILTGIGGILGVALGYFGSQAVGPMLDLQASFSIDVAYIATGISAFIGIVFGVYPASKAAKLDPIEALRFE